MKRIVGMVAAGAGAAGLALASSGCMVMKLDETSVFAPVAFNADVESETGTKIVGERAFASAAEWDSAWRDRAQSSALPNKIASYVAAKVEHGRSAPAPDGLMWTMISREAPNGVLIVRCGGNASTRQMSGYKYAVMALPHGDVLLFDYPGYGETGGEATAERFTTMRGELAALIREKAAGRKVVLWGHSLGGLVCSELAGQLPETAGVIIETSARNAAEVGKQLLPWYAAPFVRVEIADSLGGFDSANVLKGFKGPVLVLGAEKDETLPVELARSLGKALKDQGVDVTYIEFKDGGHSNLVMQPEFAPAIAAYFARVGN